MGEGGWSHVLGEDGLILLFTNNVSPSSLSPLALAHSLK